MKAAKLILCLILMTSVHPIFAQPSESFTEKAKKAHAYMSSGQIDKALPLIDDLLKEDPTNYQILQYAGYIFAVQGKFQEAQQYFDRCIQAVIAQSSDANPVLGDCYMYRAKCGYSIGNYPDSILYYKKAHDIFVASKGLTSKEAAACLYEIGNSSYSLGDLKTAQDSFQKALEIRKQVYGEDSVECAQCYTYLGMLSFSSAKYDDALELYKKSLAITSKKLGENSPSTATCYYNVGTVYLKQDNLPETVSNYSKALSIRLKKLGEYNAETASMYYELGSAYLKFGDYANCKDNLEKAKTIQEKLCPGTIQLARTYFNLGMYQYYTNDRISALTSLTESYQIKKKVCAPDSVEIALVCGQIADILSELDEHTSAIDYYRYAISLYVKQPNMDNAALTRLFFNVGNEYLKTGDCANAIEAYDWSIKIIATYTGKNDPLLIDRYINLANAYQAFGKSAEAIAVLQDAAQIQNANPGNKASLTEIYNTLALIYNSKADVDKALYYSLQALSNEELLNDKESLSCAITYNNLGALYLKRYDFDQSLAYHMEALKIRKSLLGENNINTALSYEQVSQAAGLAGKKELASECSRKAIEILQTIDPDDTSSDSEVRRTAIKILTDLGSAAKLSENYSDALNLYRKALVKAAKLYSRNEADLIIIHSQIAHIYYQMGNYAESREWYEKTCSLREESANYLSVIRQSWLEYMLIDDENMNMSERFLTVGIDAAERGRTEFISDKNGLLSKALPLYYAGVDVSVKNSNIEKAFAFSEQLRSRGFLDQLGTEAALRLPGITDDDKNRLHALLSNVETLRKEFARQSRLAPEQRKESEYQKVGGDLSAGEHDLILFDKALADKTPRYSQLRNPLTADIGTAQKWCGKDRVILEYVMWDSEVMSDIFSNGQSTESSGNKTLGDSYQNKVHSYCLVITSSSITAVPVDTAFNYAKAINTVRDVVLKRRNQEIMEPDRNALYAKLISPVIESIPPGAKDIVIVPDGPLGFLPFDILRKDSNSPDLGETYSLSFSPSISVSVLSGAEGLTDQDTVLTLGGGLYSPNKKSSARGGDSSGYTDNAGTAAKHDGAAHDTPGEYFSMRGFQWIDIPGTETEITKLHDDVFSEAPPYVLKGPEASERNIKLLSESGRLRTFNIVHLACHGYFDNVKPAMSSVVLSEVSGLLEDNQDDGYLTIPEIALLDLNANMVMLSACETGLAKTIRGDGMIGLTRSFIVAGAKNVGVSLWSVDDEATAEFMVRLYHNVVKQGLSYSEAYTAVKKEFRRDSRWSHPFYWAAFTLYQ